MKNFISQLFLCFLLITIPKKHFSQSDFAVGQTDQNGKKMGFWMIYLDERLVPKKDSVAAYYKAYNFYYHGIDMGFFYVSKREKNKASRVQASVIKSLKGKPVLLDGTFSFYDKNERLSIRQNFKGGLPVYLEGFYFDKHGNLKSFDAMRFSQARDEQLGSYTYQAFGSDTTQAPEKTISFKYQNGDWIFTEKKTIDEKLKNPAKTNN